MNHVFSRAPGADLPTVVRAKGVRMWDSTGKEYLDAAGGAIVVGIGHGVDAVVDAAAEQARAVAYAHGTMFTSDALEQYADELAPLLPMDAPRVYPVSSGSEAVETALKMARTYHLARGEDRSVVIGRQGSYHGNTRGALDVSGRQTLRAPYLPWVGLSPHTTTPYEFRCPFPDTHPVGCGLRHAAALDALIVEQGPATVAAFVAEPVAGAALGACVPPDDYWPAVAEVCRRHGVLLVADEVMTGFGRTGRWFGSEHWGLRPDILTAGKGAASGYWPLGLAVASGEVHDTIVSRGFNHGFTYSHHAVGAATARAVLTELREGQLVEAAAKQGALLDAGLRDQLSGHPNVGDIRGLGLLIGIELVANRETGEPFRRADKVTESVVAAAKDTGLLVYSSTGCADGTNGDLILLGPPLVATDSDIEQIVDRCARAIVTGTEGGQ